jgi:hypothetical protein
MSRPKVEHEEPETRVIQRRQVPQTRNLGNRVDREFWVRLIERVSLLSPDEALELQWQTDAYTHVNSGAYNAARQKGIRVSVARAGKFAYIWRRP